MCIVPVGCIPDINTFVAINKIKKKIPKLKFSTKVTKLKKHSLTIL